MTPQLCTLETLKLQNDQVNIPSLHVISSTHQRGQPGAQSVSTHAQLQGKKHLDKLPSTAQSLFHLNLT